MRFLRELPRERENREEMVARRRSDTGSGARFDLGGGGAAANKGAGKTSWGAASKGGVGGWSSISGGLGAASARERRSRTMREWAAVRDWNRSVVALARWSMFMRESMTESAWVG